MSTNRVATMWQGGWQPLPKGGCHGPYVVEGPGNPRQRATLQAQAGNPHGSDSRAARQATRRPQPPPTSQPEEAKPELITEDATIGNEERLRGIPARDILHNHLNRHRYRKDQA